MNSTCSIRPARDVTRLLDWQVPSIRHAYTRKDTAFYALSVGLGHDPSNPREHRFVDPWDERFAALPTMALVLGYPGFWLGKPEVAVATGVEVSDILHLEQFIDLHSELPVEGEVIGHTKVKGLVDKGVGRACLLYSEREIYRCTDDRHLATCRQVHYLKGHGGFGDIGFQAQPLSHGTSETLLATVSLTTRPEQALLYRLNGDSNPLHIDALTARRAGLLRPVLHGMATLGAAGHAALSCVDFEPSRLRSISLQMKTPVYPGETLRVILQIDGSYELHVVERGGVLAGQGKASWLGPPNRDV